MLTVQNYFDKIKGIDFNALPDTLQKGHAFVIDMTGNTNNWQDYYESDSIKETVDIYLAALEKHIGKERMDKGKSTSDSKPADRRNTSPKGAPSKKKKPAAPPKPSKAEPELPAKRVTVSTSNAKPVEHVGEELKHIRKYVLLHGKEKTADQILNFINALQRAIVEKRIRKTSPYATQIKYIQDSLIKLYNKMSGTITVQIREKILHELLEIAGSQKVRLSIAYLKRYIGIQGKQITKEKAEKLLHLVIGALDTEKIPNNDPYIDRLKKVMTSLQSYIQATNTPEVLKVQEATLNGIQKALDGCNCSGRGHVLEGADVLETGQVLPDTVLNSMDFAQMQFKTLGFTGKWLQLIGDPSSNFTAMVFGKPKMGKSYLCVEFAGYLARNHGKVLYVANEEGLDYTLQEKLNDKNVQHPNLFVTASLPANLVNYDFIFLDSVNRLGLTPEDLRALKAQYPMKSFIYIFQATKQGSFRGENSFQHDVDVVVEVPEKGKAVQMGRFNQGGEMEIFANRD
ncbi:MAG: ATP-binding protein [Niastella sp.]|nr:ATP-binding protein [Niastella sp.]